MKKILLTGATGFIGSNILKELSKKYKVYCVVRSKKKILKKKNIIIIYFTNFNNLRNKLEKKKFFSIIHCATYYKKNHTFKDIKRMIESNIHLGNLILENKNMIYCKKFINFTTVWENYNGIKNNPYNLYSAYKLAFSNLINFYKKKYNKIKFYNLYLSETFGENDNRKKLFNTLKENYKKQKVTTLVSKNIKLNVLNVKDIVSALFILLEKNIKTNNYSLLNTKDIDILKLIKAFNKLHKKKILFKYKSNKLVKEKILKNKKVPKWKPLNSTLKNIILYLRQ